ncbi:MULTISPECIES: glycosyltransferase family 4 protein [Phyllobacteriaceae]|jgi:glycosyltransferase involved in cell wall biosynthesis|uniref:Glycosyltransferase n=1 Tax=Mesorhizobium hungaricum TaxID=1566387 RepID=A0A1C2DVL6_9HYPH|nr:MULTISPECIES: glycosyltransferase family 4 protein [Mesorhizobium]MBN9234003.1 glycosyltransferase family 4 protein [Mesorhizobium sp.]MDQ0331535.1 glycosyltransferase involved in cell wall biosynthesis [Mesorhizobium sp. YL-MeA3-2017]OCX18838.1 glycosyltransferase [Mesorhizobium hungaricum]
MLKLLLVAPTCNGEDVGEAWVAHQWARRLGERHDVTLLTYHKRGARPAAEQLSGLRVVEWVEPPLLGRAERLNSMLKPAYVPFYIHARRWIRQELANGQHFDIAHQPVPVAMRYPSPLAGLGIPFVIGPVGGGLSTPAGFSADDGRQQWFVALRGLDRYRRMWDPMLRQTYRSADCVLGIASYVEAQLAEIPLRRFEVMSETGLDEIPAPIDRRGRSEPLRLLHVGRLVRTKGARDILRAMALTADLPVRLDIVGEGPDRAACEALAAANGLTDRVTFHGWRSKAEVADFYRAADIFVFPSYREPGGNVALEAMGYSLPLIVVDRGGPGSATSDACAIKLPVSTPEVLAGDIAAAIRKLATDPALRLKMGAAAHTHVEKTALWSAKLDRMDSIYAELLGAKVGPTLRADAAA